MRINRMFAERLRKYPFGKALLSLVMMGSNTLFGDIPRPKTPGVPERVALVRQALAKRKDLLPPQTNRPQIAAEFAAEDQFPWGNWGNWANWSNWINWNNWANWLNFFNY